MCVSKKQTVANCSFPKPHQIRKSVSFVGMEVAAKSFNVVVIGAGEINFGSREGSWNHTRRLEVLLGLQLLVVALVDPNLQRARGRIADKRASQERHIAAAWADTEAFADVASAGHCLTTVPGRKIDLVVLGCPPHFRGTTLKGSDTDVEALSVFGDRARTFLVEKPIAALDPAAGQCEKVVNLFSAWQQRSRGFVGVGYMLRYLKGEGIRVESDVNIKESMLTGFHIFWNSRHKDAVSKTTDCAPPFLAFSFPGRKKRGGGGVKGSGRTARCWLADDTA